MAREHAAGNIVRMNLWGGRFADSQHPAFEAFNRSLPFDRRLWREDIEGSLAWATAQVDAGALTKREGQRIRAALARLAKRLDKDDAELRDSDAEDIHTLVELALIDDVGELGKKLHNGRSRNDQVATDLRLWAKKRACDLHTAIGDLMAALAEKAEQESATLIPGYTHLQRAQVVTVGHVLLAYVEMLDRDRARLAEATRRLDACPLGSGALAGTALAIDRKHLAKALGFRAAARNSIDAVSDRDFVCELLFVATLSGVHLSRLSEDWIFWCSQEAGFVALKDTVTTGSSLMPQKKNPDSLELVRGKGARMLGRLTGFLACLRTLPLAYDKDLQEDKEALFDALDTWEACLSVARLVVEGALFDRERCASACDKGYLNATELADYLVGKGVAFRNAHEQAGRLVRLGLERDKQLGELTLDELRAVAPECTQDVYSALDNERLVRRRTALGSANPRHVQSEARRWCKQLEKRQ